MVGVPGIPGINYVAGAIPVRKSITKSLTVRKEFPETWIWNTFLYVHIVYVIAILYFKLYMFCV